MNAKIFLHTQFIFGDVPKWLKGPHSKCGRRVTARESSNLSISATSEQSPLCSDVFLCLRQKRRHPPAPLLLLSNCDPLRWARSWFPSGKNEYAPDRFPVGHVFIVLEWFSISPLSPPTAALRPGSARPWR